MRVSILPLYQACAHASNLKRATYNDAVEMSLTVIGTIIQTMHELQSESYLNGVSIITWSNFPSWLSLYLVDSAGFREKEVCY